MLRCLKQGVGRVYKGLYTKNTTADCLKHGSTTIYSKKVFFYGQELHQRIYSRW